MLKAAMQTRAKHLLQDTRHTDLGGVQWMRGISDDERLESLRATSAALDEVRKRYPRLETADEWDDYDGAALVHTTCNTLENSITVIKLKMASEGYTGKIRNWFSSLTSKAQSNAKGPSSQRQVRFSEDAVKPVLHTVETVLVEDMLHEEEDGSRQLVEDELSSPEAVTCLTGRSVEEDKLSGHESMVGPLVQFLRQKQDGIFLRSPSVLSEASTPIASHAPFTFDLI
jgi:hypothetical protein